VQDELLDTNQAASLLGVEYATVIDWVQAGLIPYTRVGGTKRGRLRYWRTELLAWVNSRHGGADMLARHVNDPAAPAQRPGSGTREVPPDAITSLQRPDG
jgi:excisionase family DNA binding protein